MLPSIQCYKEKILGEGTGLTEQGAARSVASLLGNRGRWKQNRNTAITNTFCSTGGRQQSSTGLDKQQGTPMSPLPDVTMILRQNTCSFNQKQHIKRYHSKHNLRLLKLGQQRGGNAELGQSCAQSMGAPGVVLCAARDSHHLSLNWKSRGCCFAPLASC